jgi:hypothetical protein
VFLSREKPNSDDQFLTDSLVALITEGGAHREWVNQEIGFARGIQKLVIPVVEMGVEPVGFLAGLEYVRLDRKDLGDGARLGGSPRGPLGRGPDRPTEEELYELAGLVRED